MKIGLIPIDNRPVCYQLPMSIANLAIENEIVMPDISLLGDLTKNAQISKLFEWLELQQGIDVYIISLDTLAYGGLIPSRRSNDLFETVKDRIDKFVKILKSKKAKVYAFSSIMRISNNNINEEEKEYWNKYGKKIFEYSYNICKNGEIFTDDIPQDIIEDYLKTRKRNFDINKYYIELYKQGFFDTLVFSKDDCAQYGINVNEANELKSLAYGLKNVFVKTGADEIPLTLLSRAINKNKKIKIAVEYTNPESIDKISKYEDISVKDSVNSQIELAGGILSSEDNCDLILIINNFKKEQGELVMNINVTLFNKEFKIPDKPYFIADILNANGSDNNFVKELLKNKDLKEFYGYSGWNTTGNTLGSAIAVALTYFGAKQKNQKIFRKIQIIRFLDDWAYQANVRAKIRDDKINLTNNQIHKEMYDYEKLIKNKFEFPNINIEYNFPWNRFFEVEINL